MPATVASLPSATAVAGSDSYDGCTKPTDTAKPPGKATVGTSSSYVATEPSGACVVMMRRGAGRLDMACVRVGGEVEWASMRNWLSVRTCLATFVWSLYDAYVSQGSNRRHHPRFGLTKTPAQHGGCVIRRNDQERASARGGDVSSTRADLLIKTI
jgi:hypothetical protein